MKKLKPILIKECIDVLPGAKQAQIGTKWHLNIPFRLAMCPDKTKMIAAGLVPDTSGMKSGLRQAHMAALCLRKPNIL